MKTSKTEPRGGVAAPAPGYASSRQAAEVRWYRKHGKYPDHRIKREYRGQGQEYVVGDWSWNRNHPDHPETVEPMMGGLDA